MKKMLVLLAAMALATPALAQSVDPTTPIRQIDGGPLTDGSGKEVVTTLRKAIEDGLMAPTNESQDVKNRRFWLAMKVHMADKLELNSTEINDIIEAAGKAYPSPLIPGMITMMLDPKRNPNK